ncbi:hypothetical protein CT0861_05502 [Colletotrichum tofieldiae]|uniref:Uncharacterized protein n=1 Tax=Colletotrichum tofieldiae TaxID=708197 RepID=A0A166Z8V9_9PEZI|nr:hypothetical protein CT0861_05502 [Colletotrichum tofieldiae]GKT94696.1 hypothetical protein Ct61P_12546 [Colletotrichum tofieldiae]
MLPDIRHLCCALSLWIALTPGAQSTQNNNNASQTDSVARPLRLADVQQCPVSPKPGCGDPNCQGARHQCATQYLCSSESPFTEPSSGRRLILAGCRCCPLPIHVECSDLQCTAPAGTRVCAAEPLQGCTCQTTDDRVRAVQERTAGWVWPLDKNDAAYDVDIEPSSGDEDEAGNSTARGVSSSSGPMATMPPLALIQDYYWAVNDEPDLKFLL